jgi:hypothetical protein
MFKSCQHAKNDSKVCVGLIFIFIEKIQSNAYMAISVLPMKA